MGEKSQPAQHPGEAGNPSPEEDPNSELNTLRREVRQLQAQVRDAALQIAAKQEHALSLRAGLSAAESDLDDALARETTLRTQLQVQRVKRQRVESTLAAAEALVSALRDMVFEQSPDLPLPDHRAPALGNTLASSFLSDGQPDLDLVLSRISDNSGPPPAPPAPPAPVPTVTPVAGPRNARRHIQSVSFAGDAPASSPHLASPPVSPNAVPETAIQRRHSMPVRRQPVVKPAPTSAPSAAGPFALLRSAFASGASVSADNSPRMATRTSVEVPAARVDAFMPELSVGQAVCVGTEHLPVRLRARLSDAHSGDIFALVSSRDGRWLASSGDDKSVRLYGSCGTAVGRISDMPKSATALSFASPSGGEASVLLAGGSDGVVRAFRKSVRRRGKWLVGCVLPVHTQAVRRLVPLDEPGADGSGGDDFSARVLSCSTDRWIKISDVENSRRAFGVATPSAVLDVDLFSGRGDGLLASGHKDGGVRLWSARDNTTNVASAKIHTKAIVSVRAAKDGRSLITLGKDNAVRVLDIRNSVSVLRELEGGVETVGDWHCLAVHDRFVACGQGLQGDVAVWDFESGKLVREVSSGAACEDDVLNLVTRKLRDPGCVTIPHWTASGQFACAHRTRQISLWDTS